MSSPTYNQNENNQQKSQEKVSMMTRHDNVRKRELRLNMSDIHFRRCIQSKAFVNLATEFDVIVRIPMHSTSNKIEVTCPMGYRQNALIARKIIEEALELPESTSSTTTASATAFFIVAELIVPWKKHHLVIGKGGAYINQVRRDHQVNVHVPPYKKRSNVVYVSGCNLERIEAAVKTLTEQVAIREKRWMATIADEVELEVPVPLAYRGRIIGTRGTIIDQLRSEFKVRITLPKLAECGLGSNSVVIKGPEQSCLAAKQVILNMTGLTENFIEVELPYVAKVYRSMLHVLNLIESAVYIVSHEHNVGIYYTFCDGRQLKSIAVINAPKDSTPEVCNQSAAHLERLWPVVVEMEARSDQLSRLIGRKGDTIRQVRQRYAVLIYVPMKRDVVVDGPNYVALIGCKDNVVTAEADVRTILDTPLQETEVLFVN